MKLPDYGAAPGTVRYHHGIYDDHLEEAGFLYEQRQTHLADDESAWHDMAGVEDRLEAHVDALAVGGDLAMAVCAEHASSGVPGEMFAAVNVFCRSLRARPLAAVFKALDAGDRAGTRAVGDALKYTLPAEWRESCSRALATGDSRLVPILAQALAYRRWVAGPLLLDALEHAVPEALPALAWSLGRVGGRDALPVLQALLAAEDRPTAAAAALAALRLGDHQTLSHLQGAARTRKAMPMALALGAGRSAALTLMEEPASSVDTVVALALAGDVSAVPILMALLENDELAGHAATALSVITGARPLEEVLVPDQPGEDEMLPEEAANYRESGEWPRRSDAGTFGRRIRRLARDPTVWRSWLHSNASLFERGRRYRCGSLCTPAVLVGSLRAGSFPKGYRAWGGDELLIRYGVDLPFESDMFVVEQRRILDAAVQKVEAVSGRFQPGRWYFAGEPIS